MITQQSPAQTQQRLIRVFVSSTFRDMQAERDELVKFIFPQLRKICEQRGVTWGEVDLRWGITDEQKSEGKVLPICLDEIQRCRPYFIGLLGERYGWIPDGIPAELIEREPWLAEHFEHSVTELEILHGVLNNPQMAEHAIFYFRDPKFLETLPPEMSADYLESTSSKDIEQYGTEEARRRTEQRKQNLVELKERIRSSGFPVHENYQNPKEFGQIVLQDLSAIINKIYPEGSQPDPLDREADEHEIFAQSRALVYIGRLAYFGRLDAQAYSDDEPLVILGESGSGKSALLANWALKYREEHPDELVLMHFIGAAPGSSDWTAMLRRILGEIKRKLDIQEEIPDKPEALRSTFTNWLNMASARGRVVLILDALNQLEDRDGAPDLVWLPPHVPENVRILLSTLPGRPLEELRKRGWPSLTIEPLEPEERKLLIEKYLHLFSKTLDPIPAERIASAVQCQNPLFLRVLLDELRLFGRHEQLGERIDAYLGALNIPALYEKILERCEQDYERERAGLVRDAMTLLWAARRGLSEAELMELLGTNGLPLPRACWSPLYMALEQSFLSRGGLIGFFHDYLRQAVQNRYMPDALCQKQAHLRLADYFEVQSRESRRRPDEFPWQLAQAREWQRLFTLLGDLEFFKAAWEIYPFEVKAYWVQVEANSPYRLLDAYRQVIDQPEQYEEHAWMTSKLLGDMDYAKEVLALRIFLVKHPHMISGQKINGRALNMLGLAYANLSDYDKAIEVYEKALIIDRKYGDREDEGIVLGNLGLVYKNQGDARKAIEFHEKSLAIKRELADRGGEGVPLSNLGLAYAVLGNARKAIEFFEQALILAREIGNRSREGIALGNMGMAYSALGDIRKAIEFYEKDLLITREIGDRSGESTILGNLGVSYKKKGEVRKAIKFHEQALLISQDIGDRHSESTDLCNLGVAYQTLGDTNKAIEFHEQALSIDRQIGNRKGEGRDLGNLGLAYAAMRKPRKAIKFHERALFIDREIGNRDGEAANLGNLGLVYDDLGKERKAIEFYEKQLIISREIGDRGGEGNALGNTGLAYAKLGDLSKSIEFYNRQMIITREIGDRSGEGNALGNMGTALYRQGEKEKGIGLMKQALTIYDAIESPYREWARKSLKRWGVKEY